MHRLLLVGIMTLILVLMYVYKMVSSKSQEEIELKSQTPVEKVEPPKVEVKKSKPVKPAMSVTKKKRLFIETMGKPLDRVFDRLQAQYVNTKALVESGTDTSSLEPLKKKYGVKTNEALLIALKPHPKSIALAQGAMESAWGTSRFFKEANNIFGVWSFNKNDKRIAAGEQRGTKTIWLKKYDSVEQAIEDYYLTLSRSKAFRGFKRLNYEVKHQNPYLLVKKLDRYSEKGAAYGRELAAMISYNKFTKYDEVEHKKPVVKQVKPKPVEVLDAVQDNESSFGDILKQIEAEPKMTEEKKTVVPANQETKAEPLNQEVKTIEVIDAVQDNEASFGDVLQQIQAEPKEEKPMDNAASTPQ